MYSGTFGATGLPRETSAPPANPIMTMLAFGQRREIKAGVADMKVSKDPGAFLATYSLGSCIGLAVYDPLSRVGGILHFQMPCSSISPEKAAVRPFMFADTGIPALFQACRCLGAEPRRMVVKAAGGASSKSASGLFNIGPRNIAALKQVFSQLGASLDAQDMGGRCSRTMWLDIATGELTLKVSGPDSAIQWRIL